jgi:hypothetical protein
MRPAWSTQPAWRSSLGRRVGHSPQEPTPPMGQDSRGMKRGAARQGKNVRGREEYFRARKRRISPAHRSDRSPGAYEPARGRTVGGPLRQARNNAMNCKRPPTSLQTGGPDNRRLIVVTAPTRLAPTEKPSCYGSLAVPPQNGGDCVFCNPPLIPTDTAKGSKGHSGGGTRKTEGPRQSLRLLRASEELRGIEVPRQPFR